MPNYTLTADAGAFALAGQVALLPVNAPSAVGEFSLSGKDATLSRTWALPAEVGAFVLDGQNAAFIAGFGMMAECGAFTLAGQPANMRSSQTPDPPLTAILQS